MQLIFLGTGAACGVPSFYCGCRACQEALAIPRCVRTRSSLFVDGPERILVDASPDLWNQLSREHIGSIDRLVLTHAHYDHCGGLGELEFYVRLARSKPLPVYMTAETATQVQAAFGFMQDCLDVTLVVPGQSLDLKGLGCTALAARHTAGTLGLLFEMPAFGRVAYLPDTGPFPADTIKRVRGVNTLILDATFGGRNWMPSDHHSVDEAIRTAEDLQVGELILTHLSLHYDQPITSAELDAFLKQQGKRIRLAYDGDRLPV